MNLSNSANNAFQIGPDLELKGQDLVICISSNRSTQLDFAAATGITINITKPRREYVFDSGGIFTPSLCYLQSDIEISALGSYEPQTLLYKRLRSHTGFLPQIEAITPEFNSLHEQAEEISRKIYDNIIYAWETVRNRDDVDLTKLADFSELKGITAKDLRIPSEIKPPSLLAGFGKFWSQVLN